MMHIDFDAGAETHCDPINIINTFNTIHARYSVRNNAAVVYP